MNNKGMTLVELLAVIAIIAILAVVVTPAVISIRESLLKSTLESKIKNINSAALDYAEEHINEIPSDIGSDVVDENNIDYDSKSHCLIRYVRVLISEGYIAGDSEEKTSIENPLTGESLNDKEICIRFNNNDAMNRKVITYIIGEDDLLK